MSIYKKLLEVSKSIGKVEKHGKNTFNNYTYATELDVVNVVSEVLKQNELVHFVSYSECNVTSEQRDKAYQNRANVKATLTVVDAESGDKIETHAYGYAEDKNGDKALFKAQTGASKYAYLKTFGLCSGEDPEKDDQKPPSQEPKQQQAKPSNGYVAPHLKPQAAATESKAIDEECKPYLTEISKIINQRMSGSTKQEEQTFFSSVTGYDSLKAIASNAAALQDALLKLNDYYLLNGGEDVTAA